MKNVVVNVNDLENKGVYSRITLQRQAHVLRMNENGRKEGRKEERDKNGRKE
jgi:hypothetical protein